jgi:hypothetical protein
MLGTAAYWLYVQLSSRWRRDDDVLHATIVAIDGP